ncbi:uncharacterized protein LOC115742430 [Rhodamnia argentea]|uniref:Uncharacterized protein LOC115742430 n=1 Tax=Rhodamnia argentea TaxID=178133 RepID=A0ABM3HPY6_9MYRT|nr:uncharacterized protein LOC115742430 [Rhodamnia argentea]XP_048138656.1 uncharacterized protein LOC115742430 [Rhodamnia argentea]
MASLLSRPTNAALPNCNRLHGGDPLRAFAATPIALPTSSRSRFISNHPVNLIASVANRSRSRVCNPKSSEEDEASVQELRIPNHWLLAPKALEESEWLRVSLHKWLDDEYCPEETNVQISKVAASSYYRSLLEKQTDLGDILLNMARELDSISYKDSFHGAFSSANAAIDLICQRIEQS